MTDEPTHDDEADEADDTGSPIRELRLLEGPPSPAFLHRLRNKIGRRSLTAQVLGLTWSAPKVFVIEMMKFVFEFFDSPPGRKGPRDDSRGDRR